VPSETYIYCDSWRLFVWWGTAQLNWKQLYFTSTKDSFWTVNHTDDAYCKFFTFTSCFISDCVKSKCNQICKNSYTLMKKVKKFLKINTQFLTNFKNILWFSHHMGGFMSSDSHFIQYLTPVTIQNQPSSPHKLHRLKDFITVWSPHTHTHTHIYIYIPYVIAHQDPRKFSSNIWLTKADTNLPSWGMVWCSNSWVSKMPSFSFLPSS
jgi:hypothetical protein